MSRSWSPAWSLAAHQGSQAEWKCATIRGIKTPQRGVAVGIRRADHLWDSRCGQCDSAWQQLVVAIELGVIGWWST